MDRLADGCRAQSIYSPHPLRRENSMTRRMFQIAVIAAVLFASFAPVRIASAWTNCASTIVVQWGDTLSGIAAQCGTTVAAIRAVNPGLGYWLYAGQTLVIPGGSNPVPAPRPTYGNTYTVKWGDTLGKIAARAGISLGSLIAANPQIANPSLIYAGQVIYLPSGVTVSPYDPGTSPGTPSDSLAALTVAYRYGLNIRNVPGGAIFASVLNKERLLYRTNSVTVDGDCKVWVEVRVYTSQKEYKTGWMMVKDQLGNYFTQPHIDNP